jgi:hypothetical protein
MPTHQLRIISLRDIHAECSHGDWQYLSPASDAESDDLVRQRIARAWEEHQRIVRRLGGALDALHQAFTETTAARVRRETKELFQGE